MNRLTKGMRMCLQRGWHCENTFICRLTIQAGKMGLRLEYTKEDLGVCPALMQMVEEGTL